MTTREEIIKWASEKLAVWQQDALRRIIEQASITSQDIEELVLLCKQENKIKTDKVLKPDVLTVTDGETEASNEQVPPATLLSLDNIVDVNALASDQNLKFSQAGLNVIYGDNGSGKTSYCRIIKKITRARDPGGDVLPHYASNQEEPQSAKISFALGEDKDEFQWSDEAETPKELSNISFFDSSCAHIYVEQETDVAYRPYDLDILDKLVQITDGVKDAIKSESLVLNQETDHLAEEFNQGTSVYELLEKLGQEEMDVKNLKRLSNVTKKDLKKKDDLTKHLAKNDPAQIKKEVQALENKESRVNTLKEHLANLREALSSETVKEVLSLQKQYQETKKAARLASKTAFDNTLDGTGGEAWRLLWEAARHFSSHVYEDQEFPATERARCLLCQQKIGPEAGEKMQTLEDFVQNDLSKRASNIKKRLDESINQIQELAIKNSYHETLLEEIDEDKLRTEIESYLNHIESKKKNVAKRLEENTKIAQSDLTKLYETKLSEYKKKIKAQIKSLQDIQGKDRSKLETELEELNARILLSKKISSLLKSHTKQVLAKTLESLAEQINTAAITIKNTQLTKKLITKKLVNKFKNELDKLNLRSIEVELKQIGSTKGTSHFQVLIKHPNGKSYSLGQVASTGEYGTIALASFFAELTTADHDSAIVLDDPVSSHDHKRRRDIALRLVQEGENRQVVIFTHDLVFMYLLEKYCQDLEVPINICRLEDEDKGKGVVYSGRRGKPWIAMTVNNKLSFLRDRLSKARAKKKQSEEEYELEARNIYGLLRETWETGVEEVLLYGVVRRYQEGVETKRLRKITDINKDDYDLIYTNMEKCSRFKHSQSSSVNVPIPDPDEIEQDIKVISEWVKDLRNNRNRGG